MNLPRIDIGRSHRRRKPALSLVLLAGCTLGLVSAASQASGQTIEYLLTAESRVRVRCASCSVGGVDQALQGTFDITLMPIPDAHAIEAVTSIRWYSDQVKISGAGFFERHGRNHLSMVADTVVNGEKVFFTSSAHPIDDRGGVRLTLTSSPTSADGLEVEIELVANANATDSPDEDGDGIPSSIDLCPRTPDRGQFDSDVDGVGDACDRCMESPLGAAVLPNGCTPEQACPCTGPEPGVGWKDHREYATCVARALKRLANADELSREQVRERMQNAVRSGCGRPVLAMR